MSKCIYHPIFLECFDCIIELSIELLRKMVVVVLFNFWIIECSVIACVISTKITKIDDKVICLSLNPKTQNKGIKTRTQKLKPRTWNVCNQRTNQDLLWWSKKHKHEKNKTRLWCKIVIQTDVEQTKGNGGHSFIHTPLGN